MPSTFKQKDEEQARVLRQLLGTCHRRLREAGVTVELLAAFGAVDRDGNLATPAIMVHGIQALGQCKITKLEHRVAGLQDALIFVDGDKWEGMTEDEQLALVDHELTHIEIVLDGIRPALDSHGRPKVRIRRHDHQFGWFDEVAERNREHSQEVQQARRLVDEVGQVYFDGMGLAAGMPIAPRKRRRRPTRPDA